MRELIGLIIGSVLATTTQAGTVTGYLYDDGPNLVFEYSGSITLTPSDFTTITSFSATELGMAPALGFVRSITGASTIYSVSVTGPGYGTSNSVSTDAVATFTGDSFGIYPSSGLLYVENGYASGTAFAGSATTANYGLATIGAVTGTYAYSIGTENTFNLTVGSAPAAIPLPAAAWMMLAGVGGLLAVRRRRAT